MIPPDGRTLAQTSEQELLASIFPVLPTRPEVLIGVGDDTALLQVPSGAVLVTGSVVTVGEARALLSRPS